MPPFPTAEANLKLVHKIAHECEGCGLPYDDLFQEGVLALLKAIQQFDPSRGFAFSSYAVPVIRGSMLNALRHANRNRVVYLSPGLLDRLERTSWGHSDTRPPIPSHDQCREWIESIKDKLDPRAPMILGLWLGLDGPQMTCLEIGKRIGRTKQRVHQIVQKSLHLLRELLTSGDDTHPLGAA
jgi:RNA polymerase sigma factor (sigma-70 family)